MCRSFSFAFVFFASLWLTATSAAIADDVPREWVDAATGHRVIRLSDDGGGTSLYFHQNTYTPEGDKLVFDTREGIVAVDLTMLGREPPKPELIVPGGRAVATARQTRDVYFRRGADVHAANVDSKATRVVVENTRAVAINSNETFVVGTTNASDPSGK